MIQLIIDDDPDKVEITCESATSERANKLAVKYILPAVMNIDVIEDRDDDPEGA